MSHTCSKCPKPATVVINSIMYCAKCGVAVQRSAAITNAAIKASKP